MNWLIESETPPILVFTRSAKTGGWQQTDRAAEHRCLIGQDIAEHVLSDDDIEARWLPDQVHRHRIDQHMLHFDIGIVGGNACGDAAPETRGLQHIRLVDTGELLLPAPRDLEGEAHDPLNLMLA